MKPKFKARTSSSMKIDCPWCEHSHEVMDNPSTWFPDDNDGYLDLKRVCSKCKKEFFVSCDVHVDWSWTSRYTTSENFEYDETTGSGRG